MRKQLVNETTVAISTGMPYRWALEIGLLWFTVGLALAVFFPSVSRPVYVWIGAPLIPMAVYLPDVRSRMLVGPEGLVVRNHLVAYRVAWPEFAAMRPRSWRNPWHSVYRLSSVATLDYVNGRSRSVSGIRPPFSVFRPVGAGADEVICDVINWLRDLAWYHGGSIPPHDPYYQWFLAWDPERQPLAASGSST